ncbi:TRAP transporter small permease [Oceanibacterium hippocampi]|uniref:TRAP transporter small permease protein n=1 Tax=Oceanibacterium hippocampi TaxID=745714 RepID=A0A1Y5RU60_9PROT|nr:TRAP transporter small permease [Oceanibacterium hippocampi]SLN24509.1 Tripartite ATP-independent periplasmic transporters, DctQ component [Oceanibacterium hippocampi]
MRTFLDALYRLSGAFAALCLIAICTIVLLQVGANLIDAVAAAVTGTAIGLVIPSYAEFAGFFLAAASFFALAYTLRTGGHIRVTLFIQKMTGLPRRIVEIWCTGTGAAMAGYLAYYLVLLVVESWEYNDLSTGMVAIPIWIPQLPMALGVIVLTISLTDEFLRVLRGLPPSYEGLESGEG